ncbi:MAG: hypothetical protein HY720_20350 [Planctomycetes bacterium]|nr:hypothetical protein [Planctomycetota bacterium]
MARSIDKTAWWGLGVLIFAAPGGCRNEIPRPDPPDEAFYEVDRSYWKAARDPVPSGFFGVWRPEESETGTWHVFTRSGLFRTVEDGRLLKWEGAYRVKDDEVYLHVQKIDGEERQNRNLWRYRYRLEEDALSLEFVSLSAGDDEGSGKGRVVRLTRATGLPPGVDTAWGNLDPVP